ncbi:hypothetical protein [Desulfosporosinus sp. SB140]|uniref:hypothetical protein n=1 Tax=Desulfosporosinus paludis TaxID=3115649 RepID=UPI00388F4F74
MKIKSNNPANIISAKAKKAGLSYWGYIGKHEPGKVHHHVWGAKKLTSKDRAATLAAVEGYLHKKMGLGLFANMRNLVFGRGY